MKTISQQTLSQPRPLPFPRLSLFFKRPQQPATQRRANPFLSLGSERCAGFISRKQS
jgi:hypothetical protein